jgi:Peptidase family M3
LQHTSPLSFTGLPHASLADDAIPESVYRTLVAEANADLGHQDTFDSASPYTHEWSHGLHTLLANGAQPVETAGYPLFLAEIAAFTHELLLQDQVLKTAANKDERLFYLGEAAERLLGTFFRQTTARSTSTSTPPRWPRPATSSKACAAATPRRARPTCTRCWTRWKAHGRRCGPFVGGRGRRVTGRSALRCLPDRITETPPCPGS